MSVREPFAIVRSRSKDGHAYGWNSKGEQVSSNGKDVQVGTHLGGGKYKWREGSKKDLKGDIMWYPNKLCS
jgi:hypothetical protein